ncbi:hypothetical protein ACYZTX_29875 [Pseudomonas sp. MDT1-17]
MEIKANQFVTGSSETAMLTPDMLGVTDENPDYRATTSEMFVTIGYQR